MLVGMPSFDSRNSAKRRLPRVAFDYIDGGADAERTLRENVRVVDDVRFRPRAAVSSASLDLATTVLGWARTAVLSGFFAGRTDEVIAAYTAAGHSIFAIAYPGEWWRAAPGELIC